MEPYIHDVGCIIFGVHAVPRYHTYIVSAALHYQMKKKRERFAAFNGCAALPEEVFCQRFAAFTGRNKQEFNDVFYTRGIIREYFLLFAYTAPFRMAFSLQGRYTISR